MNHIIFH